MRNGVLIFLLAMLVSLNASAQISAKLQIAMTNGNVALSLSGDSPPSLYYLQAATSLADPIHWNSILTNWGLNVTMPAASPQQFYRIVQSTPVFELAIFYNLDLEINPGSAMTINGRVHGNNNIYATGSSSGSPLTFLNTVEAVQQVNQFSSPLDPRSPARNGNVVFSITNNPLSNVAPLFLPIGATNDPATILGIPPADTDPASTAGLAYLYNEADIIITNSPTGTLAVYYQNLNMATPQIYAAWDVTNINLITHTTNTYYSFASNVTFYDYRESKTVKAVQMDVAKFSKWLTNSTSTGGKQYQLLNTMGGTSKGHGIDIVYFYNGLTNTSGQLPAVRVINGAKLPTYDGLTVATPFPIYVQGDYNTTTNGVNFSTTPGDTTNTRPAAIMGDAITILSANWNDSYTSSTALSSRNPTATTINAACLEGIVPSNGTQYSGGVENFLRLLENWAGVTLTYNGSIVVPFPSQYATSFWNGGYFGVPTRRWGFDPNFLNQGRLPPATPMVVNQASP
jgi:hypothetical protein